MSSESKIQEIPGYTFYKNLDHSGCDIKFVGRKSIDELKEELEAYEYGMGFNTLGWIKHSINPDKLVKLYGSESEEDGIYIKDMSPLIQEKIKKLVSIKYDPDREAKTFDLTFTVTTCKRLDLFRRTMEILLINCSNLDMVREFICIDDNSTPEDRMAMVKEFPFFTYIMKTESEKGHPRSMNMLMNIVKTKYNMHFEDDWSCNKPFDLKQIMDHIIKKNLDILILRKICWSDTHVVDCIDGSGEPVWQYIYNGNHSLKPALNREYDENTYPDMLTKEYPDRQYTETQYWWWPGFTLNPSIINFELIKGVGPYKEDIMSELFEYDFALRCHYAGIKTSYINLNIEHIGTIVSSYTLNDLKRYYD